MFNKRGLGSLGSVRDHSKKGTPIVGWIILGVFLLCVIWLAASGKLILNWNLYLAKSCTLEGQYSRALAILSKLESSNYHDPRITDATGLVYLYQGLFDQAQEKYAAATREGLRPSRLFNHLSFGSNFIAIGRYQEALVEFKHAVEIMPNHYKAHRGLAEAYHALCELEAAIPEYQQALALNPNDNESQKELDRARQDRDKGSVAYMFDRLDQPLARRQVSESTEPKSNYPFSQYTAHLVGYVSSRHGSAGLEKVLAQYFPGNKVTLTIDASLQRACSKILGWNKGAIVALDPKTGEIIVALSQPLFNPSRIDTEDWYNNSDNPNKPFKNRAFEELYMPGSIAKIITTAAVLEKKLDLSTVFPLHCKGSLIIDGTPFLDWKKHGRIKSLEEAFDNSCNVSYAKLGRLLGADALFEYTNKFGIQKVPPIELPVLAGKTAYTDTSLQVAEWANGVGKYWITPLHAAMLAAAIANDGVVMKPYLIKEIKSFHEDPIKTNHPAPWFTAISKETARKISQMMLEDTVKGIGKKASVIGISVAGKTGTTGSVSKGGLNGWFICFAPVEKPKIALAVYIENGGTGMDVAAPIAGKVLSAFFTENEHKGDE